MSINCPNCGLICPDESIRCDCGYPFGAEPPGEQSGSLSFSQRLRGWWERPIGLADAMTVEFDDAEVRVRVRPPADPAFNQTFRWVDITRVCFKDQGMYGSDFLYIELRGCEKPAIIVTDAKGGPEFFGKLCDQEFLPGKVWRSATGETRGSLHCWPPKTADKRLNTTACRVLQ